MVSLPMRLVQGGWDLLQGRAFSEKGTLEILRESIQKNNEKVEDLRAQKQKLESVRSALNAAERCLKDWVPRAPSADTPKQSYLERAKEKLREVYFALKQFFEERRQRKQGQKGFDLSKTTISSPVPTSVAPEKQTITSVTSSDARPNQS